MSITIIKVNYHPMILNLYKTWSNVYLIEMGNAIANHDFDTYAFYMSEYEQALNEENIVI